MPLPVKQILGKSREDHSLGGTRQISVVVLGTTRKFVVPEVVHKHRVWLGFVIFTHVERVTITKQDFLHAW